ncbi:hypothetical protein QJU87_04175 [Pasteurella skyensis]|uniref:hypothetical protein n=1 Tax=Phocoenobacter skyensis TaxID=97481 RepID=UPI0027645798|nr:hypothetical protein [Pasteurella skyensis]MDP8189061.1 hypothetical protein [Pasteurella skyensis]
MRKLAILTIIGFYSTVSFAVQKENTIFSCTTDKNKTILVEKVGNNYQFSYDNIMFKNPIKQVITNLRSEIAGGSGFTTSTLELINKGSSYIVGFTQPRGNPKLLENAGFYTITGDKYGDDIQCKGNIYQNFDIKQMKKSGFAF